MTWNPASNQKFEHVNIADTIASRSNPSTGFSALTSKYRSSDGATAEWEFPEVAPLVFPALDHLAAQTTTDSVQKKNKLASSMAFVTDYWDRRATAQFVNPESLIPMAILILFCFLFSFSFPFFCLPQAFVLLLTTFLSTHTLGRRKPKQRLSPSATTKVQVPLRRPQQPCSVRLVDRLCLRRSPCARASRPWLDWWNCLSGRPSRARREARSGLGG